MGGSPRSGGAHGGRARVGRDGFRVPGSKAASELVETVLAMDDFVRFKAMMLQLKEEVVEVVEEEVMARFSRGDRAL